MFDHTRSPRAQAALFSAFPVLPLLLLVLPACCALAAFGVLPWVVPAVALPVALAVLWLRRFVHLSRGTRVRRSS
ncbi:hypothetical protein [Streptomyces huiliensis]|uniref:hypothetical protein n=1 Tax=Streptomyces huiliensis TaxID=2876027 RepID=UPI001CBC3650|nr:hypothetical protein [Streptomyces huiliensis]MBZ4323522.1 hypothetical protein [Streptomyces huiliensis]